jgi:acylphosphatase
VSAPVTRRYLVKGRVQGVGFRWFVSRVAEAFDIAGWTRNTDDGDVEIVARGTPENLRSFKEQIEIGPDASRVDRIVEGEQPAGEGDAGRFDRFHVIR